MQNEMQIVAGHLFTAGLVAGEQGLPAIGQDLPIGSKLFPASVQEYGLAQGRTEKSQGHHQGVTGQLHHILGDSGRLVSRVRAG